MTIPIRRTALLMALLGGTVLSSSCTNPRSADIETSDAPPPLTRAVIASLTDALEAYEDARRKLAAGTLDRVADDASRLAASALQTQALQSGFGPTTGALLEEAALTAEALTRASELEEARRHFGEVSRLMMLLVNTDSRLAEGWHVFICPDVEGFNKWMQRTLRAGNPYQDPTEPACGDESDWTVPRIQTPEEATAHAEAAHLGPDGEIAHYTCSMHPSVKRQEPGTCPICSMGLVPVTREEQTTGVILVDAQRRQLIGVRTGVVERRRVVIRIRAVGRVTYDETRLADVTLKNRGWIGDLYVDATGEQVHKGQPLFTLYSPEIYSAQEEFLAAVESQQAARQTTAPDRADYLVDAARTRLRLWDISEEQIDGIAEARRPLEQIPILSPVSGHVIEKDVVAGAAVEPGRRLYRIAALDRVWVEVDVYESELPLLAVGQDARITLPYLRDREFRGRVAFIYPYLESTSRTGRVRIELSNDTRDLKPEMYANVEMVVDRGLRLVVPESAVVYAGPRRLVFLDLGEGRLRPQRIEIGLRTDDGYEILSGLDEGDRVVSSGNFLIAAESRLKSATEDWK